MNVHPLLEPLRETLETTNFPTYDEATDYCLNFMHQLSRQGKIRAWNVDGREEDFITSGVKASYVITVMFKLPHNYHAWDAKYEFYFADPHKAYDSAMKVLS